MPELAIVTLPELTTTPDSAPDIFAALPSLAILPPLPRTTPSLFAPAAVIEPSLMRLPLPPSISTPRVTLVIVASVPLLTEPPPPI